MTETKCEIIQQLRSDILQLQGFKPPTPGLVPLGLEIFQDSFPNRCFPTGAVHEFLTSGPVQSAATDGFIAGLLSTVLQTGNVCVWISASRTLFPPGLTFFGLNPDCVIFIDLRNEREVLWAMEEALKCDSIAAVIGELNDLSFTVSRRFQLAVEQSKVTGFVLRKRPKVMNNNACVSRWEIEAVASAKKGYVGVGFPNWHVRLSKMRHGSPGSWHVEWTGFEFKRVSNNAATALPFIRKIKTG